MFNNKLKYAIYTIVFLLSISCSNKSNLESESQQNFDEYGLLKFENADIEFIEENLATSSLKNINDKNQTAPYLKSSSNASFECDIKLESSHQTNPNINISNKSLNKQGVTISTPVRQNVKYRIYVYDKISGNLATSADYIRGQENTKPLKLVGGKDYIVVAYSINSTENYPAALENATKLNTAEITNENVDFMFFKETITIANNSTNTLKVKFKHKFCQITTTIKLDQTTAAYSYIRNISSASFIKPSYNKTKFKVDTETITGIDENQLGAEVTFPFIELTNTSIKSITTSKPTIINSPPSGQSGKMIIEALTIGNVTRGNLVIENLNFTPGVKYNLILTFKVPETTEILDNPFIEYYDDSNSYGTTTFDHSVELNNPTYGAQLDIFYLDNSFQLFVNEKPVFSREINFEDYLNSDVRFSDGTWYGSPNSGTAVIYNINRTKPRKDIPVIRLVIDEKGQITLFGRKKLDEQLRILNFRNNVTYTPVQFIPDGKNTLKFRSTNWNITDVWGRIYGIRVK